MAITINGQYAEYANVKDTFPVSTSLTGTISSVNNGEFIVGVGTLFGEELQIGEWIYVDAENEFRQIRSIASNTELYLYKKFTNTLTGATPKRIPRQTYKSISWKINSTAPAEINAIPFEENNSGTLGFDEVARKRPDPILINATSAVVEVQFQY